MTRFVLRTLGRLSLHREGPDGEEIMADAKILALLAYLEDTPEGRGDRTHLARLLWPEADLRRARAGLRQALYYLRRKVPDEAPLVRSDQERIALDRRHLESDFRRFRDARSRGAWDEVITLYRGPFLGGFSVRGAEEFRLWRDSRDDGVRAVVREACRSLVSESLGQGDPSRALRGARRWVGLDPLDEEAQTALIRSLVAAGDRAGAFEAYESYRTQLREELGESPGPKISRSLEELRSLASDPLDVSESRNETARRPIDAAGGDGAESERRGPTSSGIRRWSSAAVGALVFAMVFAVAAGWSLLTGGETDGSGVPVETTRRTTHVVVQTGSAGEPSSVHAVRWLGDTAAVRVVHAWIDGSLPGPLGERIVKRVRGPEGIDLALEELGSGVRAMIADSDADESPVAWSPDGRRLLYRAGRMEEDGVYRRRFRARGVGDPTVDSLRLFTTEELRNSGPGGAWSPLGTSIALVSDSTGNPDVWIVRPDGDGARNLTEDHAGFDGEPAFSTHGSRLAFVSDRGGDLGIWAIPVSGGSPAPLADSRWPERGPVWLSSRTLGYFRVLPDRAEFRVLVVPGGESRVVATLPGYRRNLLVVRTGEAPSWIASLELPDELHRVSPGQWIRPGVFLRGPDDRSISPLGIRLDWSVSDSSVLDPAADGKWMRVTGEGETVLSVTAGGWRGDTITMRSRAPVVMDMSPALEEDWSAGLDTSVWVPVGEPLPTVVDASGRFPHAFLNRGDENYSSGAVTRPAFRTREGLTVEVWGRVPYTNGPHQAFQLGLLPVLPQAGALTGVDGMRRELALRMHPIVPDSVEFGGSDGMIRVPAPESRDSWHRYTLQLDPAGRATFLVDGRVHWRWPEPVHLGWLDGAHLGLYGRSKGTRILHGPVRVWEGVRYRLP